MSQKTNNVFAQLQDFERHIEALEERIYQLENRLETLIQIERNHLIRVKNNEEVSDEFLMYGRKYQDLSPEKASKLYSDKDYNFILIDVSARDYRPEQKIQEAIHIPWNEFPQRYKEIGSKVVPILIISEDGTNSVLACEFLVSKGYYNCNNISGGHKYWKGLKLVNSKNLSA